MWGYEMHGGWMVLWGLAGLLVLGIVVYAAVRLALGDLGAITRNTMITTVTAAEGL